MGTPVITPPPATIPAAPMTGTQNEFFQEFYEQPAAPVTETVQAEGVTPEPQKTETEQATPPAQPPVNDRDAQLQALMDQYAQEEKETLQGLSPDAQQRLLRRLAEKELVVRETRKATEPAPQADVLTPFEKELLHKEQAQPGATPPAKEPAAPAAPTTAQPPATQPWVGANWRNPADAILDKGNAWSDYQIAVQEGDPAKQNAARSRIAEIENAEFLGRLNIILPVLEQQWQKRLDEALGPLLPQVSAISEERAISEARNLALSDLAQTPGMEKIEESLFKPGEGTIEFEGKKWENTPLNRLLKENPWLMDIRADHSDPAVAQRLTLTRIYKAAYTLLNRGGNPPVAARALVQAGQEMERKTEQEKFRQGLNGGSGSVTPPGSQDYIDQIKSLGGRGMNLSDL